MRSRALSGILALAVAAAVGWLLLPGEIGEPGGTPPPAAPVEVERIPCDHDGSGLPPPPVEAKDLEPPGDGPPPPPAEGPASLSVLVVDAATRLPVKTAVVLWRLGLPEDGGWTAGDLRVGSADAGEAPARFRDLAPGRYRVQVPGKRSGEEDPPEFPLEAGQDERTVAVRLPGTFRAWIRLFDEEGREVEAAERTASGRSWSDRPRTPGWASPRVRKGGEGLFGIGGGGGGTFSRRSWSPLPRDPRGFDLGEFAESSEFRRPSWRVSVHPTAQTVDRGERVSARGRTVRPEREGVVATAVVHGDLLADTDFVAPAPTREALLGGFEPPAWLPEGLRGAEPSVRATCGAVPLGGAAGPEAWRRVEVSVEVRLGGRLVGRGTLRCDGPGAAPRWEAVEEGEELDAPLGK